MLGSDLEKYVAFARIAGGSTGYGPASAHLNAAELPGSAASSVSLDTLRNLFQAWGLDDSRRDRSGWNPLGDIIPAGSRIAIKPNWVYHAPRGPATLDCLITHTSVIQGLLEYLAITQPSMVTIGDAPIQSCDFAALRKAADLESLEQRAVELGIPLQIIDFRRTISGASSAAGKRVENARSMDHFVEFDLGDDSCLRPLDADADKFRVTVYNPDLLNRAHKPGSHKYLIAREILEADVVINMPKLKCHKKACITGALKNLVGINGHKEYLPHHRKGGSSGGGDCYPGSPAWKRVAENIADFVNRDGSLRPVRYGLGRALAAGRKLAGFAGMDDNLEGAWFGNDTVWRMCIDLNRILLFGRTDGRLHEARQRTVISITDAIIAGQGDGPLTPSPLAAGFLTGSTNPAAAEYVHARLMGFDPERIPIITGAFENNRWPIADFRPSEIRVRSQSGETPGPEIAPVQFFDPPTGWRGHCELQRENVPV